MGGTRRKKSYFYVLNGNDRTCEITGKKEYITKDTIESATSNYMQCGRNCLFQTRRTKVKYIKRT